MALIFSITAGLSAFLLFLVQPLVAKPILPLLGGSPSVWNTCMVAFQLLLLLGYSYAYVSSRFLTLRRQSLLHLALFGVSLLLLPLGLRAAGFEGHTHPQLWLLVTLMQSVGGPYFLLSSSAPMLQRWAARTSHALAKNPYPLYAASNTGSFFGLIAYPLLIEPRFTTPQQFSILTAGYLSLVAAFFCCAFVMRRYARSAATPPSAPIAAERGRLVRWLTYSAIPASLLFGTTTFIITDIASVPLLWIIPLLLYIASFIVAFSERRWNMRVLLGLYVPLALLTLFSACYFTLAGRLGVTPGVDLLLMLASLFAGACLFHRRLYELRPQAEDSGLFYVILALGGAIGGCFNSFVAPHVFSSAVEFPLLLAIGLLVVLLPDFLAVNVRREKPFPREAATAAAALLVAGPFYISGRDLFHGYSLPATVLLLTALLFAVLLLFDWMYRTPWRTVPGILASVLLLGYLSGGSDGSWIHAERNFFGISRVQNDIPHARRIYTHGVTVHGMQSTEEQYRLRPIAYYGPLRDIFAHLPVSAAAAPVGVVGLGVGTVACYAKPGQSMDFYEIDPASVRIATTPDWFTYMRDCPGNRRIIVGDGRLTLGEAPTGSYGFIIMDAFTSDAIPMHLLTLEALTMYGEKLQPDGLIAFNISNRYLNLLPVFQTLSHELGWTGRYRLTLLGTSTLDVSSIWVVLAKHQENLEALARLPEWQPLPPAAGRQYRWTDDYTNLLSILRFKGGLALAK